MCQGLGDNYLSDAFILRGPESMRMVETKAAGAGDDQNQATLAKSATVQAPGTLSTLARPLMCCEYNGNNDGKRSI